LAARVPDGKVPSRVLASNVDFRASCNLAFRLKFEKCALLPPPLRVSFVFPESPLSAFFCVKFPISMYRHISRYGRPVLKVEAMFMIGRRTAPRDLKQGNGCGVYGDLRHVQGTGLPASYLTFFSRQLKLTYTPVFAACWCTLCKMTSCSRHLVPCSPLVI
jgi:hypothetical protein